MPRQLGRLRIITLIGLCTILAAQDISVYKEMSLDELLNVDVVVTASKKPEDLFEAPLSTTIIKRSEIERSGAGSIVEALRLVPGVIVREMTSGNFDIQIRGFDDITKSSYLTLPFNTTTLVMVDNRIVYSYFTGGTFWEALSIDIHDVERIEVVRGPASALYGSNAATGVINIITTQNQNQPGQYHFSGSVGSPESKQLRASKTYRWFDQHQLTLSGHYRDNVRPHSQYYAWKADSAHYRNIDDMILALEIEQDPISHDLWNFEDFSEEAGATYDVNLGQRKMAANLFYAFEPGPNHFVKVSSGLQYSQAQKAGFFNFATPLSINTSRNAFLAGRFRHENLFGDLSVNAGEDQSNFQFNSYQYQNLESNLEYQFETRRTSLRPGIGYKRLEYNSPLIYSTAFDFTILNDEYKPEPRTMHVTSAAILMEAQPINKLRLIGGLRVEKFSINKNLSVNYEAAATYRLNKSNLFRAVHSQSTRSPFFFDTYLNTRGSQAVRVEMPGNELPLLSVFEINMRGGRDQLYPTNVSTEIAWRRKMMHGLGLDIELFQARMTNIIVSNLYRDLTMVTQYAESGALDSTAHVSGIGDFVFENFDISPVQTGLTSALQYQGSSFSVKLFGTIQVTKLTGTVDQEFITTSVENSLDTSNYQLTLHALSWTNPTLWSAKLTPRVFGGVYVNYIPAPKWNINLNLYFSGSQTFGGLPFYNVISDFTGNYWDNYMKLDPFTVVNLKISRQHDMGARSYISLRNMLGQHREFGFTDPIGLSIQTGFEWTL